MKKSALIFLICLIISACDNQSKKEKSATENTSEATENESEEMVETDTVIDTESQIDSVPEEIIHAQTIDLPDHHILNCYSPKNLLTAEVKTIEDEEYGMSTVVLTDAAFQSLSFNDKLIYCMSNPEEWDQICAEPPPSTEGIMNRDLPYMAEFWSQRQYDFFKNNRQRVINAVNHCLFKTGEIDVSYFHLFLDLNAFEPFPDIIKMYKDGTYKEPDVLTYLITQMDKDNFQPYEEWMEIEDIFAAEDENDFMAMMYPNAKITKELEEQILSLAESYYTFKTNGDNAEL